MVSTWGVTYPGGTSKLWVNRAQIRAFSFIWWESVPVVTPNGGRLDALAPFEGWQIHMNLRPEFRVWSSNHYTLDYVIADGYATMPGGAIWPGTQGVVCTVTKDPCYWHTFIRWQDVGVSIPYEHVFELPNGPGGYWLPVSVRPVTFPAAFPVPRTCP